MNRRQVLVGLGALGGAAGLVTASPPAFAVPARPLPERTDSADLVHDLLYRGEPQAPAEPVQWVRRRVCYWDRFGRRVCRIERVRPRRRRRRRVCWWRGNRRVCVWRW